MTSVREKRDVPRDVLRRRTVTWIVTLATVGLVFDGYDLVVYGAVLPQFLRDPSQIGAVTPAMGGALGSYALIGVLVGALLAGSVGDVIGRRKVMLTAYAWFSVGMGLTTLTTTTTLFGLLRFGTGIGVGALVATTGALVAEFAPKGRKNLCNAITYSGVPLGSLLAALVAILLLESVGWRGMFLIGALPLVTLLPLALLKMPESPAWLLARGRVAEARAMADRTGVVLDGTVPADTAADTTDAPAERERAGFAGLLSRSYLVPTILLGLISAIGLLLVYALNTWLPELMGRAGYSTKGSLAFLLVLNGGAVVGAMIASRFADRFGPKPVVVVSFLLGAASIVLLTVSFPVGLLLAFIAVVGLGTSGTQILIYGFVATYYRTSVRGAGVAWCAGFGRLGGIGGPLIGGLLIASGLALNSIFYALTVLAVVGALLTVVVPKAARHAKPASAIAKPGPDALPAPAVG
jgi:AAHS family benzoate transporter-like MFS transporter